MEANKPTRTLRTDQEIFKLMEDFEKSDNLSIAEFCEIYEISNGLAERIRSGQVLEIGKKENWSQTDMDPIRKAKAKWENDLKGSKSK